MRSIHQCCDQLRGTLHTRGKTCNTNTGLAGTSYTPTGWTDQLRSLGWVTYSKVMYLVWFLGYQWWVPFFPPQGGASPPNSSPVEISTWIYHFPKILTYWLSYQFRHHNPTQLEWTCHIRFNRENWEIQQLKYQLREKPNRPEFMPQDPLELTIINNSITPFSCPLSMVCYWEEGEDPLQRTWVCTHENKINWEQLQLLWSSWIRPDLQNHSQSSSSI